MEAKSTQITGRVDKILCEDDTKYLVIDVLTAKGEQHTKLKGITIAYIFNFCVIPRAGDKVTLLCIATDDFLDDNIPIFRPSNPQRILFDVDMTDTAVMKFFFISAKIFKWPTGTCNKLISYLRENGKIADELTAYAEMKRGYHSCDKLEEFLTKNQVDKLLHRWCKEFLFHRYYLYGLNLEYTYILKEHYSYQQITHYLQHDPYVLIHLPISEVEKIIDAFGWRYTKPLNRSVGEIARYLYGQLERHLAYVPKKELDKYPPEYLQLLYNPDTYNFILQEDRIYYWQVVEIEDYLANFLHKLTGNKLSLITECPNTKLKPDQYSVMLQALNQPVSIITGGAGTGKTTIIGELVNNLTTLRGSNCTILSYTGKAVRVIQRKTGNKNTMTLHRSLHTNIEATDVIIIDEVSMCPTALLMQVLKCTPNLKQLIFVGDHNQLPPIHWCELMRPLMEFLPCFRLEINYRTSPLPGEPNTIVDEATRLINDTTNCFSFQPECNFHLYEGDEQTVLQICRDALENGYSGEDCTIICPFREDTNRLNEQAKTIFNAINRSNKKQKWCIGDRVMVIKNIKSIDVMNGEEGTVEEVDKEGIHVRINTKIHLFKYKDTDNFNESELLTEKPLERHLTHSWAITAHKSQGSEWPVVIGYIPRYSRFITRNIIYVMMTRATEWFYLVGKQIDIDNCCNNLTPKGRSSLHTRFEQLTKQSTNGE